MNKELWTIGHSVHLLEKFIELLRSFNIHILADIRSLPGSKRFPHFNKENLQISLKERGIEYVHLVKLGGRRKVNKSSKNLGWKHPAFRAYADYMETDEFKTGIEELVELTDRGRTAIMCAEVLWWRCHRSLVSDYLKFQGWKVYHIISPVKAEEHPYTKPAVIQNGKLEYSSVED